MADYFREASALFDYTKTLRRDLHRHPELGFKEFRTASIVAAELEALGIEVSKGSKTGVVVCWRAPNLVPPSWFDSTWMPCPSWRKQGLSMHRLSPESCMPAVTMATRPLG